MAGHARTIGVLAPRREDDEMMKYNGAMIWDELPNEAKLAESLNF